MLHLCFLSLKEKKTFSETFWLIFNTSFQILKMLFHWVVVNIHLLAFWKVCEKTSSGENPQLESLK